MLEVEGSAMVAVRTSMAGSGRCMDRNLGTAVNLCVSALDHLHR